MTITAKIKLICASNKEYDLVSKQETIEKVFKDIQERLSNSHCEFTFRRLEIVITNTI